MSEVGHAEYPWFEARCRRCWPALCALPLAHADIYTWTDESGRVNVSNLTPPEGARVTRVVRENKAAVAARDAARETARDALREAEVRVLAERVRQLQDEVEIARRPAPPQVEYSAGPHASVRSLPHRGGGAAAVRRLRTAMMNGGCSFGWPDCGLGWYPGIYPVNVVVARPPHFRRDRPDHPATAANFPAATLPAGASLRRGCPSLRRRPSRALKRGSARTRGRHRAASRRVRDTGARPVPVRTRSARSGRRSTRSARRRSSQRLRHRRASVTCGSKVGARSGIRARSARRPGFAPFA